MFGPSFRAIARSARPSAVSRYAPSTAPRIGASGLVRTYSDKPAEETKEAAKEGEASAAANGDAEKVKGLEEKIKSLEVRLSLLSCQLPGFPSGLASLQRCIEDAHVYDGGTRARPTAGR